MLGPDFISHTLQLVLAPVVMVSACAILLGSILARYSTINDRLRVLNRERLDLLPSTADPAGLNDERLRQIDAQTPTLLHRLRIGHQALGSIYTAILLFILDMVIIALVDFTNQVWAVVAALVVFFLGLISLGVGVLLVARELRMAMISITYEVERVRALRPQFRPGAADNIIAQSPGDQ